MRRMSGSPKGSPKAHKMHIVMDDEMKKDMKLLLNPTWQIAYDSCERIDENPSLQSLINTAIQNPKLWYCPTMEEAMNNAFNDDDASNMFTHQQTNN